MTNPIPQIKLYRPDGKHKAFRLYLRKPDGSMEKIPSEELALVNKRLKLGLIGGEEAGRLAEAIQERHVLERDRALGITPLLFTDDNTKVYKEYEKSYNERNIRDKSKADRLTKMKRALGSLQGLSIVVATRSEMSAALKKTWPNPSTYNELAGCINSLLKFQGRDSQLLFKINDEGDFVRYISLADFEKLETHFNHNERLLMRSGIGTGMRFGENIGAETRKLKPNVRLRRLFYHVERQWHMTEKRYCLPKRGKKRDTVVLQAYEEQYREFLELDFAARMEAGKRLGERIRAKAYELWPKHEEKHVNFQDLRHSFATHLLAHGVSLSHVARFLGNGLKVTEEYYASFAFSDEIYSLPAF